MHICLQCISSYTRVHLPPHMLKQLLVITASFAFLSPNCYSYFNASTPSLKRMSLMQILQRFNNSGVNKPEVTQSLFPSYLQGRRRFHNWCCPSAVASSVQQKNMIWKLLIRKESNLMLNLYKKS